MDGVPRDETAADSSDDGSKNTNKGTDPDLFMNTSGEDCTDEQEGTTNPHILSESESDERDMDTIPPPNPPNKLPNGSEPAHGTGTNAAAQDMNENAGGAVATPPNQMNQAGEPPAASVNLTADAEPPAGTAVTAGDLSAASSSGGIFSSGNGSGPSAAIEQAGCSSGSGIFNNNLSNFNFCPTPETVKKSFRKKKFQLRLMPLRVMRTQKLSKTNCKRDVRPPLVGSDMARTRTRTAVVSTILGTTGLRGGCTGRTLLICASLLLALTLLT
jgi:hypothetical protein